MRRVDTPWADPPDTLAIELIEQPFRFGGDDVELARLVVEAVNRMGGIGDAAEEDYQGSLAALRDRAPDVAQLVQQAYDSLDESQYLDRWSLVQLLADLREPTALGLLRAILVTDVPQERSREPHDFSTVAEEVMILTTAVEAVARLALGQNSDAVEVLFEQLQHAQFSVRRASVQALLALNDERTTERVREQVTKNGDERLLAIVRVDVREVPQPAGGRFLAGPASRDELPRHDEPSRQRI